MDLIKIARNLENERCSRHNEKPKATVKGDKINLFCCCDEFKTRMIKKMEIEISKQVEDEIRNAFKF